ncbi:MAG: pyridoxal phosphate-dependent aminotransferase [Aestuariivirgaceae bacterium]|nr:pyridoxal phosphate-dependent aminotransferase [Aestuariivirgaceae bacterium]
MISTQELLSSLRPGVATEPMSGIVDTYVYALGKPDVIPLWVGQGHLPTPAFIAEPAAKALAAGETFYTHQRGLPELRQSLAHYHARTYGKTFSADNFTVCQSGMQSIQLAVQAILSPGDEVILPVPAWTNYAATLRLAGMKPVEVALDFDGTAWTLDPARLFAAITPRTRAILVNTPGNPLGHVLSRDVLQAILDEARRRGLWIIADEVYGRFFYGGNKPGAPAPSFLDTEERIFFCNTFSKNWAMTGWRVGWCMAPKSLGPVLENLVQYNTSGVTTFLQRGCIAALDEGDAFLNEQIQQAEQGRRIVCERLAAAPGANFAWPEGAFYLFFRVDGQTDSAALSRRLIDEARVGLAPGSAFGPAGEGFMRLCFARDPVQLAEAAERLGSWLERN